MFGSDNVFANLSWVVWFTYGATAIIAIVAMFRRNAQWVALWLAVVITSATAML